MMWAVIGVVGLVLLALVALRLYFPPEKIKAIALKEMSEYLHREVRLGDVGLNPLKGLSLVNLEVSEKPTFAQGKFFSIKRLNLFVAMRPLLNKEVIIRSVTLESPEVTVIRLADGKTFNFSDLVVSSSPAVTTVAFGGDDWEFSLIPNAYAAPAPGVVAVPAPQPSAFKLDVAYAEIKNGIVHFIDRSPAKSNAEISALNVQVKEFSPARPFHFQTDAKVKHAAFQGRLSVNGQLDLAKDALTLNAANVESPQYAIGAKGTVQKLTSDLPTANLAIDIKEFRHPLLTKPMTGTAQIKGNANRLDLPSFQLSLAPLAISGYGLVENLAEPAPSVRMHVETNRFPIQEALAFARNALPPDLKVSGPAQLSADISGTLASARVAAKVDGKDLSVHKADVFRKAAGVAFDVSMIGDCLQMGDQLLIDTFKMRLGTIQANGAGSYKKARKSSTVDLTIKTNSFPLSELAKYSPSFQAVTLAGNGTADVSIKGDMNAPAAEGRIALDKVTAKNAEGEASGVSGQLSFQTPHALAKPEALTLKTNGQLNVAKIQHAFYRGNNAKLTWNLTDVTQDLSRVSGDANMTQGEGNLLNAEKLATQFITAKILLQPLILIQKVGLLKKLGISLDNIPFASIRGDYKLQRGLMTIQPFELSGSDVRIETQGTVGLAGAQPLNLRGAFTLASGLLRGTLGQIFQGAGGRSMVKFTVGGTVENPDPKLDLQETTKKAVQTLGQDLLKGILRKDSPPPPASPDGSDASQQPTQAAPDQEKPLKDIEKALKGIFR